MVLPACRHAPVWIVAATARSLWERSLRLLTIRENARGTHRGARSPLTQVVSKGESAIGVLKCLPTVAGVGDHGNSECAANLIAHRACLSTAMENAQHSSHVYITAAVESGCIAAGNCVILQHARCAAKINSGSPLQAASSGPASACFDEDGNCASPPRVAAVRFDTAAPHRYCCTYIWRITPSRPVPAAAVAVCIWVREGA